MLYTESAGITKSCRTGILHNLFMLEEPKNLIEKRIGQLYFTGKDGVWSRRKYLLHSNWKIQNLIEITLCFQWIQIPLISKTYIWSLSNPYVVHSTLSPPIHRHCRFLASSTHDFQGRSAPYYSGTSHTSAILRYWTPLHGIYSNVVVPHCHFHLLLKSSWDLYLLFLYARLPQWHVKR